MAQGVLCLLVNTVKHKELALDGIVHGLAKGGGGEGGNGATLVKECKTLGALPRGLGAGLGLRAVWKRYGVTGCVSRSWHHLTLPPIPHH